MVEDTTNATYTLLRDGYGDGNVGVVGRFLDGHT